MTLNIKKTVRLVGEMRVDDKLIKVTTVDIDENGVSTAYDSVLDENDYVKNRTEIRKQEKAFREKRYEVEDEILAEVEEKEKKTKKEKEQA